MFSNNKNFNSFYNYLRLIVVTPVTKWIYTSAFRGHKNFILAFVSNHIIYYGTPVNLTYSWSFGSLAGVCLVIQIISGLFLAMFYTPHVDMAFASIEFIMRDVNNGWLVRYIHSNGASMFFLVVYCHIFRGLYYNSYAQPRGLLWISGTLLLLLMMATAFLGYVLPWGQMSFWGATVITSMFSAIPSAGKYIVEWLWGGFTVNNPTLNRFFSFHFFLPFVIVGVVFLHLTLLHKEGSSAPLSDSTGVDQVPFYPYYFVKDLFAFFCFFLVFVSFIYYYPNALGDPNNYVIADPIHTPRHIVPEWYFLPFYAILRSIPHKSAGILAMLFSLLVLFILPFINTSLVKDSSSRLVFKIFYFAALGDFLLLGWLGQSPVKDGYIFAGQLATAFYFLFFLVLLPFSGVCETAFTNLLKGNNNNKGWFRKFIVMLIVKMIVYVSNEDNNQFFRLIVYIIYFLIVTIAIRIYKIVMWIQKTSNRINQEIERENQVVIFIFLMSLVFLGGVLYLFLAYFFGF